MAFQPIVNIATRTIFGYEALVRGLNDEPAAHVLSRVDEINRYRFDQACRVTAVALAARLGLRSILSINFMPNAVYRAETCIRRTLEAATEHDFPTERIMFEVTEAERVTDHDLLKSIVATHRKLGFITAIDDFGAGYAGLNLLADFQPQVIKLDMALTRNIHRDHVRHAIVSGILGACRELAITPIAEGIECREECLTLAEQGVELFQGYFFARPAFEALPDVADETWGMLDTGAVTASGVRRAD